MKLFKVCKGLSKERKRELSAAASKYLIEMSQAYKEYKQNGGILTWKKYSKMKDLFKK